MRLRACNVAAGLPTPDAKILIIRARGSGAMFAPPPPPARTFPGSLWTLREATLSFIADYPYYNVPGCEMSTVLLRIIASVYEELADVLKK